MFDKVSSTNRELQKRSKLFPTKTTMLFWLTMTCGFLSKVLETLRLLQIISDREKIHLLFVKASEHFRSLAGLTGQKSLLSLVNLILYGFVLGNDFTFF